MPKKIMAVLRRKVPAGFKGKWIYEDQEFEVEVMAIVRGYAMVRRPGCVPFVEMEKNLEIKK